MDIGGKLMVSLMESDDIHQFFKAKLTDALFEGDELGLFKFVSQHVVAYHSLPKIETVKQVFTSLPKAIEPVSYYVEKVTERFAHRVIKIGIMEAHEKLTDQNPYDAIKILNKAIKEVQFQQMRQSILEFGSEGLQLIAEEYHKAQGLSVKDSILFGWPYLDNMTSGLVSGDVVSYIGRPATGKTFKLLFQALNAWFEQSKNVLFLSMEMGIPPIAQRLSAMYTHMPIDYIKKATFSSLEPVNMEKLFFQKLATIETAKSKLWVVDGNLAATPEEIYTLAAHLKPNVVFIDGAYLLRHKEQRMNQYQRVADNIEYIKAATSKMGIPTVLSYQFNRVAAKKKDEDPGLEDIAYSDAIGQISSIVLGLLEHDSVETMKRRRIKIMKGREGAIGEFYVNWNFKDMDFTEIPKGKIGFSLENKEAKVKPLFDEYL